MRLALVCVVALGCDGLPHGGVFVGSAEPWPEADRVFHQDAKWQGGDGAASVDLLDGRRLWLFGDTFVGATRQSATVVPNSVGVMTGYHPDTAAMAFEWRRAPVPGPFFADDGDIHLRPTAGIRAPTGELVVFATERVDGPGPVVGGRALRIVDPSGPSFAWGYQPFELPAPIACVARDDGWLVGISPDGSGNARVVRWKLARVAAGDFADAGWWDGKAWNADIAAARVVAQDVGASCSLRFDVPMWAWMFETARDGLAIGVADDVTGPYELERVTGIGSAASAVMHDLADRPIGEMRATYVESSDARQDLIDNDELYWPRFVKIGYETATE